MKCLLVDNYSNSTNPESVKRIFARILNLLYLDTTKIKQDQTLKLYDSMVMDIIYIFHFLMNDIEIYRVFFGEYWKNIIDVDFVSLVKKLIEEIEILKEVNQDNHKIFSKLDEVSNDFLKINNLFLFKK